MMAFAYASAGIMACLATLHLIYTLHDFGPRPRYFRPRDETLLPAMRTTRTALAPDGRDYWSGILGFHLSHAIGLLLFALLIILATTDGIGWLKPLLVCIGGAYAAISYRCWFKIPTIGVLIANVLMILGWWAW